MRPAIQVFYEELKKMSIKYLQIHTPHSLVLYCKLCKLAFTASLELWSSLINLHSDVV